MEVRRTDLERSVTLRSAEKSSPAQDVFALVAMLCSVGAMLLRYRVLCVLGVLLHLSSFAQSKLSERSAMSLLTNLSVSLMALVMINLNPTQT